MSRFFLFKLIAFVIVKWLNSLIHLAHAKLLTVNAVAGRAPPPPNKPLGD